MTKHNEIVLEPTTRAFIDALAAQGGKPLYTLSYAEARKFLKICKPSTSRSFRLI